MHRSRLVIVGAVTVLGLVAAGLIWLRSGGDGPLAVESFVQCPVEGCVAESVGTATGRLWMEHEDISGDPATGMIGFQRTYFRDDEKSSSFGPGWRSILDTRLDERDGTRALVGFPSLPGRPLGVDGNVVTFAEGTRWVFDDAGWLIGLRTRTGRSFDIRRSEGRVTLADGERTLIEVTYKGERVDQITDERADGAGVVSYRYDGGRLSSAASRNEDQEAETYRYAYNPGGGLKKVVSAGGTTLITWADSRTVEQIAVGGQATKLDLGGGPSDPTLVTLPGATKPTEYRHDRRGRLTEIRQGSSVPLLREYGAEGRLVRERDQADDRHFTWTDGRLTGIESTAGRTTVLSWDDLGRLASSAVGRSVTTYEYDDSMWAPSKVTTDGAVTTYRYQEGRLVEAVDADGVSTKVDGVDAPGLVAAADGIGDDERRCIAGEKDDGDCDGRAKSSFDAAGRPNGLTVGDAKGSVTYDEYGRIGSTSGPNGQEVYTYDTRGRISSTRRGEVTFTHVYEGDRLALVTSGGDEFVRYKYDELGRVTELASSQGKVTRTYDGQGRIKTIEDGGLEWNVAEFSAAGRPKRIDTPYGMVTITYGENGRPDRTEVSEYGRPDSPDRITTTYDWKADKDREVARVARGGYISTLTFDDGVLTSARTPLGRWNYSYSKDFPGHLREVAGPNGKAIYTYDDVNGAPQLKEAKVGDESRTFEWDDLGRLTAIGGDEERSFEYRQDGITEDGPQGRKVTWNEEGLPETVESDGATEIWAWNPDRTLKSITSPGGLFSADVVWTTKYDKNRLTGLDRKDSQGDLAVDWIGEAGEPTRPALIKKDGTGPGLALKWTVTGELQLAKLGDEAWEVGRDSFRNVTKVTRSGEGPGEIATTWRDGLPVRLSSGPDSLAFDKCTEFDCAVELEAGERTAGLDYSKGSIIADVAGRKTVFTRNEEDGLITKGCQEVEGKQACTSWPVKDPSDLARFEALFEGTDGQIRGLATRPLPPDPPALATLPDELTPEGLDIELPDETLEATIAATIPVLPETYRLDADGAEVRLATRLAPTTVAVAHGPGVTTSIAVFGDEALGRFESPFRDDAPLASLAGALEGIEPDSVTRPVIDVGLAAVGYLPEVLGFAAQFLTSLFTGGAAGAVILAVAAGACIVGSTSCGALAVAGALMLIPGIGQVVGLLLRETLTAIVDGAVSIARGVSWEEAAIGAGAAILIGVVARGAQPVQRLCRANRVWCLDAARTPEAAANATQARRRGWGVLTVDRANSAARRSEALRGTPTRSGFDRDEFPPAATRQGGAGARVAHISPSDNRAAGASLRSAISGLDDGQRFLYLVVDSSDRPFTMLDSVGAGPALSAWAPTG